MHSGHFCLCPLIGRTIDGQMMFARLVKLFLRLEYLACANLEQQQQYTATSSSWQAEQSADSNIGCVVCDFQKKNLISHNVYIFGECSMFKHFFGEYGDWFLLVQQFVLVVFTEFAKLTEFSDL